METSRYLPHNPTRWKSDFTIGQSSLFCFLLAFGIFLIGINTNKTALNIYLVFVFTTVAGLQQCLTTQRKVADPKLQILTSFWLFKIGLTLFLLYVGWTPQLEQGVSISWGYDPQRYYLQAYTLSQNNFQITGGLNYQGILYFYGVIFYIFGHDPAIPALINAFITLIGTLYLIRFAYGIRNTKSNHDWKIAFLLLLPELLWYDVLTSRETLMATLIVFGTLPVSQYIIQRKGSILPVLLVTGISILSIIAIRTTMIIPVVGSVCFVTLTLRSGKKSNLFKQTFLLAALALLFAVGPMIQTWLGGREIEYSHLISGLSQYNERVAGSAGWTDNSIGKLFMPHSFIQSLFYVFPRAVLYLITPLPRIAIDITGLLSGSWFAWQHLLSLMTTMLNIAAFPYVLAGSLATWRNRRIHPAPLILYSTFWYTFISIVGGNVFIHGRYRVMSTLLLFVCAWFGYTNCTREQTMPFVRLWIGLLSTGVLFYILYKGLL